MKIRYLKRIWTKSICYNIFQISKLFVSNALDALFTRLVRKTFKSCGDNFYCKSSCIFRYNNNIVVGENVRIGSMGIFDSEEPNSGFLQIKDNVQINDRVIVDFSGGVTIGENAFISSDSTIYTHSHGFNPRSIPTFSSIFIGSDVWIGAKVLVKSSVKYIGEGSIIGSGSVLTKDVEPFCVYAGVPAKKIKSLK